MLSRLGRFLRGRFAPSQGRLSGKDSVAGDRATTEPPQPAEALRTAEALQTEGDPFARQVLRRVRPLSVSRPLGRPGRSLTVSTTQPLAQAAPPRVRSDLLAADLPLATPARPVPAGAEEEPAAQPAADTRFFEGSTGDPQWDALWAMRGTRRSVPEEPAPPEGDAPERSSSPAQPTPRRLGPASRTSAPPVQRASSPDEPAIVQRTPDRRPPGERSPEPRAHGPAREGGVLEARELSRAIPPAFEPTGVEAEAEAPAALDAGSIEGTTAPPQVPAPARRETDRSAAGDVSPPATYHTAPPPMVQRSQAPAARPAEEPRWSQELPAREEAQAGRGAEHAAGAVSRREGIVPRSRLEELPTPGQHARGEQPAQPMQPLQRTPAQEAAPQQAETHPPRQVPTPPPTPAQRAVEGVVEEPAEGGDVFQPLPPVEPGVEQSPPTPQRRAGALPRSRTGPVQQRVEPGVGPEAGTPQVPEVPGRDVAAPGPAAAGQDLGRPAHGQVPVERAPESGAPVQAAPVEGETERPRPAPPVGRLGERAFNEPVRGEPVANERGLQETTPPGQPPMGGSEPASPQPARETPPQPAAMPARRPPVEASSPAPGTVLTRTSGRREPAPSPEAIPGPSQVQPASENRTSVGESPQRPAERKAHAQVDAATAAQRAVLADKGDTSGEAVDRRALLRQALQPRIVPTVVQAAPDDGTAGASVAGTQQAGDAAGAAGEAAGPDIESLARDVYRILRRRLLVEQERELGRR